MEPDIDSEARVTLGEVERLAWMFAGGAVTAYGLTRRSAGGLLTALIGGGMIYRGINRHRHEHAAMGARRTTRGIRVKESILVNKPPEELYRFWRNFENLPRFMYHLQSVRRLDEKRSHWVVRGPAGMTVEWDAEIVREIENELVTWQSLENADIHNAGSVSFKRTPDNRTEVTVVLRYAPPAGTLGAALAKLMGENPAQQVREELTRFRQLMESGGVPTIQP